MTGNGKVDKNRQSEDVAHKDVVVKDRTANNPTWHDHKVTKAERAQQKH